MRAAPWTALGANIVFPAYARLLAFNHQYWCLKITDNVLYSWAKKLQPQKGCFFV